MSNVQVQPPLIPPSPGEAHDSAWYRKAFGAGYLDLYAHRDDADAARAVQFLQSTLKLKRGVRLLDLCCGPGRHLAQLAPLLGWAVGLDLSRDLLSQARESCQISIGGGQNGRRHHYGLIEGDMRHLPFASNSFHVVTNLFTSFGYFENENENAGVIGEIARVVKPGGAFVLDHINRSHLESFLRLDSEKSLKNNARVIERRAFDSSLSRVIKHVQWHEPDGESMEWTESVRVYDRDEVAEMLASTGLTAAGQYGDYDGSSLTKDSPRMITLARKP